jgi:hypothetical protein
MRWSLLLLLAVAPASAGEFGPDGGQDQAPLRFFEPTVAVHPLEPAALALANGIFLRVSVDAGDSFNPPFLAPVPFATYENGGDPSLAFDSQGRLFWTYLGLRRDNQRSDVFIAQFDPATGESVPGYPVNVSAAAGRPALFPSNANDKEWLAADRFAESPFRDRLYVVWSRFAAGTPLEFSYSTGRDLEPGGDARGRQHGVRLAHVAVGPRGEVYVAYHVQPGFLGEAPDGTSGHVVVLCSDDGGASFASQSVAYAPGRADVTFNEQVGARELEGSVSWTIGAAQAWVLPDVARPDRVYVVAADDPSDELHGAGFDDMDVYLVRSSDRGTTWSAPLRVDAGPEGSLQLFPTGAVADDSGCLTVAWYDTRSGATNPAGHWLLDFLIRSSADGGESFGPEHRVNDAPVDPDLLMPEGPSGTLRIGEYNGVAVSGNIAHLTWTGNTPSGRGAIYDRARVCVPEPARDLSLLAAGLAVALVTRQGPSRRGHATR